MHQKTSPAPLKPHTNACAGAADVNGLLRDPRRSVVIVVNPK
jgi:hypothetical protein